MCKFYQDVSYSICTFLQGDNSCSLATIVLNDLCIGAVFLKLPGTKVMETEINRDSVAVMVHHIVTVM